MIRDIVAVPGLSATGEIILVGVQGENGRFFWADCVVTDVPAGVHTIQHIVRPALLGQSLRQFRPLAEQLESLSETVTFIKTIPPPENAPVKVSRRALFTGLLTPEPKTETVVEKRPISTPIQFALSWALLTAVAHPHPITQVLTNEYGLERHNSPAPLTYTLSHLENPHLPPHLLRHTTAVYYTVPQETPIGKEAELLQRQVQQLKEYLVATYTNPPPIYLNLNGRFTTLFQKNVGKMLGAFYGLEQVSKPCQLYIANPIQAENLDEQFQMLRQLKTYLQMRHLQVQLVITPQTSPTHQTADICHCVHLSMTQLGSLSHTLQWAVWAKEHGLGSLLEGPPTPASQLAQAVQPALILCHDLPTIYNELVRGQF